MSFIGKFIGKVFGSSIAEPINAISDLLDRITLTDAQKAEANHALALLNAGSSPINKAKAFLIVICDVCMALYWIPQIVIADYFWVKECFVAGALIPCKFDPTEIIALLLSALGLTLIHYKK